MFKSSLAYNQRLNIASLRFSAQIVCMYPTITASTPLAHLLGIVYRPLGMGRQHYCRYFAYNN
jgi:hypothetical protein